MSLLIISVFYQAGDDPFICEIYGKITINALEEIEKEFTEFELDKGDGTYVLSASYFPGQYGEYGACELRPGWELDFISFEPVTIEP